MNACPETEASSFGALGWLAIAYLVYIVLDLVLAATVIVRVGIVSTRAKKYTEIVSINAYSVTTH